MDEEEYTVVNFKELEKRIIRKLEDIRNHALERGFDCTNVADMCDDVYRWSILISPKNANVEEHGVDVTIHIAESEHHDGEENGCNFMLDIVAYGGAVIGGCAPYNFTSQVWVPRDDWAAVDARWRIFDNSFGEDTVLDHIEFWWAKKAS